MGYVIQETGLFPHFTVERNVGVVLEAEGRPREERAHAAAIWPVGLDPDIFYGDIRTNFPAGSDSASDWRARWLPSRRFC